MEIIKDNKTFKLGLIRRSLELAKRTIKLVDKFPKKTAAWVITDQLLRSITSIGSNIVEAQASISKREFVKYLSISLKSGNESKFWLVLSKELDQKLQEEINDLIKEADELVKILGSSISTLKGRKKL